MCTIALNRCKYKNTKHIHAYKTLKTVGVQIIMLKHPTKHKKNTHRTHIPYKHLNHMFSCKVSLTEGYWRLGEVQIYVINSITITVSFCKFVCATYSLICCPFLFVSKSVLKVSVRRALVIRMKQYWTDNEILMDQSRKKTCVHVSASP